MSNAGKKILLIDDSEFILESTSTLLQFEDYEVFTASDGHKGIQIAIEQKPDLIICDISMPGISGYEVISQLRNNKETASIPFIFLSAFTEKSKMREGMERGADDYLTKPFTKNEIISAINAQWKKYATVEKKMQEKVEEVGKNLNYALPHEFRTVLSQLIGSARLLNWNADSMTTHDIKEVSNDMISVIQRLTRITDNFLLYMKLENISKSKSNIEQLRTQTTIEPLAIISDNLDTIAQKYSRLEDVEILNPVFDIDVAIGSELFAKLVDELFDNAFKFSTSGTKVTVESEVEDENLFLKISDRGIGMTQEQIGSIGAYMQFQRDKYEQQGVGIGLEIARLIATLHNGTMKIVSKKNEGTTIYLSLPLATQNP